MHVPELCLSTTSENHTIKQVCGTDKTIHTCMGKISSNYSLSITLASPHINSHSRFIQDRGCRWVALKGTHRGWPSKQFLTKSLAWSKISFSFALPEEIWLLQNHFFRPETHQQLGERCKQHYKQTFFCVLQLVLLIRGLCTKNMLRKKMIKYWHEQASNELDSVAKKTWRHLLANPERRKYSAVHNLFDATG